MAFFPHSPLPPLLAPLLTPTSKAAPPYAALVWFRVILFKLLFMTAVVKLQSRCPACHGSATALWFGGGLCVAKRMPSVPPVQVFLAANKPTYFFLKKGHHLMYFCIDRME